MTDTPAATTLADVEARARELQQRVEDAKREWDTALAQRDEYLWRNHRDHGGTAPTTVLTRATGMPSTSIGRAIWAARKRAGDLTEDEIEQARGRERERGR